MLNKQKDTHPTAITEMQITWIRYHYTSIRMTKITESDDKNIILGGE